MAHPALLLTHAQVIQNTDPDDANYRGFDVLAMMPDGRNLCVAETFNRDIAGAIANSVDMALTEFARCIQESLDNSRVQG